MPIKQLTGTQLGFEAAIKQVWASWYWLQRDKVTYSSITTVSDAPWTPMATPTRRRPPPRCWALTGARGFSIWPRENSAFRASSQSRKAWWPPTFRRVSLTAIERGWDELQDIAAILGGEFTDG